MTVSLFLSVFLFFCLYVLLYNHIFASICFSVFLSVYMSGVCMLPRMVKSFVTFAVFVCFVLSFSVSVYLFIQSCVFKLDKKLSCVFSLCLSCVPCVCLSFYTSFCLSIWPFIYHLVCQFDEELRGVLCLVAGAEPEADGGPGHQAKPLKNNV